MSILMLSLMTLIQVVSVAWIHFYVGKLLQVVRNVSAFTLRTLALHALSVLPRKVHAPLQLLQFLQSS